MIGSTVNPALGRVDYSPITQGAKSAAQSIQAGGQAYGNMFANLGQQIGSGIQQYQQNKQKRDFLETQARSSIGEAIQLMNKFNDDPSAYGGKAPIRPEALEGFSLEELPRMSIGKLEAFVTQTEKLLQKPRAIESFIQQQAMTDAANQQRNTRIAAAMTPPQANAPFHLGRPMQPDTPGAVTERIIKAGGSIAEALAAARAPSEIRKTEMDIKRTEAEIAASSQPKALSAADTLAREKFELEKVVAAAEDKKNIEKERGQADYFKQKNLNTVSNINRLIALYETGAGGGISGIKAVGQLASFIPFNDGRSAITNTLLDSVKAALSIDEINRMKAFSKTGATGFGSLSDKEGMRIESNIANLEPTLPREEILKRLKQVKASIIQFGTPSAEPLVINKVTKIN